MKTLGKIITDMAPTINNGRNSEGAFIRMDNGAIAFAYSKFVAGRGYDDEQSDIAVCFSFDEGETFTKERVIISAKESGAQNLMSVSLLKMQDGSIGVFYAKKITALNSTYCMRKTRDFIEFSKEITCLPCDRYYVVNNDRVRRLSNGDIIIPASYFILELKNPSLGVMHYKNVKSHGGIAQFFISKDDGQTWSQLSSDIYLPVEDSKTGLQEGGIEELDDGRLYSYFRTDQGCQFQSISLDGGKTWGEVIPSRFTSPTSPMNTKRLKNGKFAIVYNPTPLMAGRSEDVDGAWTGGRNPLVLRFADGNMKKIGAINQIEKDKKRGFCYSAIFETEDGLLLGYCAGGGADYSTLNRLRIRKIYASELENI